MKKYIPSILFLLWFFASLGLSIYFSEQEQTKILILVTIGQLFFVMGLIASIATIKSKEEHYHKYWILIFPMAGLGMIIAGLGIYFDIDFIKKHFIILIPIGIFLLGIILLINNIQNEKRKKKYCIYEVIGKIVGTIEEIKRDSEESHWVRYPVYEFYYQSVPYLVSKGNLYDTKKEDLDECNANYPKGEIAELMINPNNPYEWEYKQRNKFWLLAWEYIFPFLNIIIGIILTIFFSKITGLL